MNRFKLYNKLYNTCKYIAVAVSFCCFREPGSPGVNLPGFARLVFVPSMQFVVLVTFTRKVVSHSHTS